MRLTGHGVSPGIGVGRALVVTRGTANLRFRIPERRIDGELARLDAARAQARVADRRRSSSASPPPSAPSTRISSTRSC